MNKHIQLRIVWAFECGIDPEINQQQHLYSESQENSYKKLLSALFMMEYQEHPYISYYGRIMDSLNEFSGEQ